MVSGFLLLYPGYVRMLFSHTRVSNAGMKVEQHNEDAHTQRVALGLWEGGKIRTKTSLFGSHTLFPPAFFEGRKKKEGTIICVVVFVVAI